MLHHEAVRNVALETRRLVSTVAVKTCRVHKTFNKPAYKPPATPGHHP